MQSNNIISKTRRSMKKDFLKTMLFMLCALCAFSFTACSDDDPADAASQVAGAYTGDLEVFMGGQPLTTAEKTITLTKKTATTVDIVINNFTLTIAGLGSVDLGNVTIPSCALTESGNGYNVAGTITLTDVEVPVQGVSQPLVVDCTVTLNGATADGTTFNMPLTIGVMMGDTDFGKLVGGISATFTGTK